MGFDGVPTIEGSEMGLINALTQTGLAQSNREARQFIQSNAVSVNGEKVTDLTYNLDKSKAIEGKYIVLRRGKKLYGLVKF